MTIRQIVTDWTATGGPAQTVMFFSTAAGTVGSQRQAVHDLWTALAPQLVTPTAWVVQQSGSEMNEATGQTTGAWSDAVARTGNGSATGQGVADSTQILLQWRTGAFRDGHEVRGRSYVPGMRVTALTSGEISSSVLSTIQGVLTTQAAALALQGMIVWHRPVYQGDPPTLVRAGDDLPLGSGSVWKELAVLRRRRS